MNVRAVITPRQPRKILLDSRFEVPLNARLLDGAPTWIFTAREDAAKAAVLADRGIDVICLPDAAGKVDLMAMMQWLGRHEINEVHAEAGEKLNGSLLRTGCVDELLLYLAPTLLGEGAAMAKLPLLTQLDQAQRYRYVDVRQLGDDLRVRAQVDARWQALRKAVEVAAA